MEREKAYGILFGLAIGDALAYPVEFMKLDQIYQAHGAKGVQDLETNCQFSDDTQMSLAITHALLRGGEQSLEEFMEILREEFILWKNSPENNRAPGKTCMAGVANLEKGIHWTRSGISDSKGCGSAMRVAPIGYLYSQDPEKLKERAHFSGICTHGHASADASCIGGAYLVKLGMDQVYPREYIDQTLAFVEGISKEFEEKLLLVEKLLQKGVEEEHALALLGEGWHGYEAVALGLYCFLRSPKSYPQTVIRGANTNGDSDSIACIAGFISGAHLGKDGIPKEWREKIEKKDLLSECSENLWKKKKLFYSS